MRHVCHLGSQERRSPEAVGLSMKLPVPNIRDAAEHRGGANGATAIPRQVMVTPIRFRTERSPNATPSRTFVARAAIEGPALDGSTAFIGPSRCAVRGGHYEPFFSSGILSEVERRRLHRTSQPSGVSSTYAKSFRATVETCLNADILLQGTQLVRHSSRARGSFCSASGFFSFLSSR